MAFTKQKTFTATLDGTNAYQLAKKLKREMSSYDERLGVVQDILENTKFFEQYFSDYYDANINTTDYLSLENNICLLLESYATYLLNSNDIKEEDELKYKFYYDESSFKKAVHRESFSGDDNTLDFLLANSENFKKEKKQKITPKDLTRNDWCGMVLREYQSLIDFLNNSELPLYTKNRIKGEVQRDMILAKDKILHVFGYNLRYFSESTQPDMFVINFFDEQQLKGFSFNPEEVINKNFTSIDGLLRMKFNGDFQNDFQCILYDIDELVKKTDLKEKQSKCLSLWRDGLDTVKIGELLSIPDRTVRYNIDSAISKVAKKGKELRYTSY